MPIEHPSYEFHPLTAEAVGSRIDIGPNDYEIEVPRIDAALADEVRVDANNPWYSTDGKCLFSKDGTALVRCLTSVESYDVPPTCTSIEDEAFAYNTVIRHVSFPEGLVHIGDRAFICSTLDFAALPTSLRSIGTEAFSEGKNLRYVTMQEGIESIGEGAFSDCGSLERAVIPASVRHLGNWAFSHSRIKAHGADCGLSITQGNERYFIDDRGVLYRRDEDGLSLMCALDPVAGSYHVQPGTVRIMERAFAFNRKLERIEFADSLIEIGKRAFLECEHLVQADLPDSVRIIGAEAFYHSSLEHLVIPASLESLGPASLVVNITVNKLSDQTGIGGRGATDFYHSTLSGKLHEVTVPRFNIEVSPDNPRFTLDGGFLCEYQGEGKPLRAVQFVGGGEVAAVPRTVSDIAEYALFGVEKVRELHLHTGIEHIGHSALNVSYPLDLIEIDDGADTPIRLYPAPNGSGTVAQRKAFRAGWLDLDLLVKDCDSTLSFMMPGNDRTSRMLLRLANGRRLTDKTEREFSNTVRICLDELVRLFARTEDRKGIRSLLDLGFIDGSNIAHVIEVANGAKGIACARLLLEEKRSRFPDYDMDFSL